MDHRSTESSWSRIHCIVTNYSNLLIYFSFMYYLFVILRTSYFRIWVCWCAYITYIYTWILLNQETRKKLSEVSWALYICNIRLLRFDDPVNIYSTLFHKSSYFHGLGRVIYTPKLLENENHEKPQYMVELRKMNRPHLNCIWMDLSNLPPTHEKVFNHARKHIFWARFLTRLH